MSKKSNLIDIFKTNKDKEVNGSWYSPYDGIEFLIARFGGANKVRRQEIVSKFYAPHSESIKNNTFSEEDRKRLDIQSFVHTCVLDWKGVTIDDEEVEFNAEDLVDMLLDLDELADALTAFSFRRDNYKDSLGNS